MMGNDVVDKKYQFMGNLFDMGISLRPKSLPSIHLSFCIA